MTPPQRTPYEWFQEAARCYVEGHQACAWCGGSHRVYRTARGGRVEYCCNGCDFQAGHDLATGEYFNVPGEETDGAAAPKTMFQI